MMRAGTAAIDQVQIPDEIDVLEELLEGLRRSAKFAQRWLVRCTSSR